MSDNGFFDNYGGKYVAEVLRRPLDELEVAFHEAMNDKEFLDELAIIRRDYIGRETPLYFACRLEDLKVTKCMENKGSAYCFKAMHQKAGSHKLWKSLSFKEVMDSVFCNKSCVHSYLGIENGKRKKLKTN